MMRKPLLDAAHSARAEPLVDNGFIATVLIVPTMYFGVLPHLLRWMGWFLKR